MRINKIRNREVDATLTADELVKVNNMLYESSEKTPLSPTMHDRHCVMMAYVQLSLAGIQAKVVHGNTLTGNFHSCWHTPMYILKGCDF